jgi:hypothetical protein
LTPVRAVVHLRTLWPGWTILLPVPFLGLALLALVQNRFHWEHLAILGVALALFSVGPRTKRLFLGAYPCGLVGVLYDGMRVVKNFGLTPERVHLCDLRAHELALFGVPMGGERVTLHDWFLVHHWPLLDLICSIPYGVFIFVILACAVFLYVHDYQRMVRFAWGWLALNLAGFITYHLYPAAPPWYFHAHGCAVDLASSSSEGAALARVDASLGISYFSGMYGRASDVFGAVPSLHCAYALIIVVETWAVLGRSARSLTVAFFALMCFSAVYLDHHWVIDVLAGIVYCLVVVGLVRWIHRRVTTAAEAAGFLERAPAPSSPPGLGT